MSVDLTNDVAYGFSQGLLNVFAKPIVSVRAPTTSDKAAVGRIWVKTSATILSNAAYICTSNANNTSVWLSVGGGAGDFSSLLVTGSTNLQGNVTIGVISPSTISNLTVTGTTQTGGVTITSGGLTANSGDIKAATGMIQAGGDAGTGTATITTLTNATGAGGVVPGSSSGYIKVYVGATTAFVPYFTSI